LFFNRENELTPFFALMASARAAGGGSPMLDKGETV